MRSKAMAQQLASAVLANPTLESFGGMDLKEMRGQPDRVASGKGLGEPSDGAGGSSARDGQAHIAGRQGQPCDPRRCGAAAGVGSARQAHAREVRPMDPKAMRGQPDRAQPHNKTWESRGEGAGGSSPAMGKLTSLDVRAGAIQGDAAQQLASAVLAKLTLESFSGMDLKAMRGQPDRAQLNRLGLGSGRGDGAGGSSPAMDKLKSLNVGYNGAVQGEAQQLASQCSPSSRSRVQQHGPQGDARTA